MSEHNMNILIAGCGYVGMRAAQFWKQAGHSVFAITRSSSKAEQLASAGIEPVTLDLGQQDEWPQLPAVHILLWSVGFDRASGQSREVIWIDGFRRLLQTLPLQEGGRVLMTSSTGVYGDAQGDVVTEETPATPASESGIVCLKSEDVLREYSSASGASASILRLAGIYGPGRLLRRLDELKNQVPISSPPEDWLNLVHVDDIVRTLDVVARMQNPPPLMNVAAAQTATRREYYSTLAELTQSPPPIFGESSETAPGGRRANGNRRVTSVIRSSLGLTFQHESVRSGLAQALSQADR
ncbi:MAG: SDR family oxidoreductase [Planctomycetaceae bacterium]|nr:SDR family oxidoreductase [Planctomycetaceae bacterium]